MAGAGYTYKIIQCPFCGNKIERRSMNTYRLGSPFRICPRCKKEYIDEDYHELAIEDFRDQTPIKMYLLIAGLFTLIIPLCSFVAGREEWLLFTGIFYFVFLIIFLPLFLKKVIYVVSGRQKKTVDQLKRESIQRFRDPMYCMKMIAAGYKLPEELTKIIQHTGQNNAEQTQDNAVVADTERRRN